mgnify:CR=1 FL=1
MKKILKFISLFIGFVVIILSITVIATTMFFTGNENFYAEVEGVWETTQLEKPITFQIFKGSRAVQGYTYGYFDAKDSDEYSYHIRYKDQVLEFVENDPEQFLEYSVKKETIEGKIYLPNQSSKKLTSVILKKVSD